MITRMRKLRLIGPKSRLKEVISTLHDLNVMHISENSPEDLPLADPLRDAEGLADALLKANALAHTFNIDTTKITRKPKESVDEIIALIKETTHEHQQMHERIEALEEQKKKHEAATRDAYLLKQLKLTKNDLIGYDSITAFVGTVEDPDACVATIKKLSKHVYIKRHEQAVAVFVDKKTEEKVKDILSKSRFTQLSLEKTEDCAKELSTLRSQREQLSARLQRTLPGYIQILERQHTISEAPLRMKATQDTFVLHGYLPEKKVDHAIDKIQEASGETVHVDVFKINAHDDVPVELTNAKATRSFQFLLKLYALPRYNEFDPTILMFITFPFFFGFMLGDAGYGVLTLGLFFIMRLFLPQVKEFMNILMLSSAWTIVWGLIYSEAFGLHLWYDALLVRGPSYDLTGIMVASIVFGILHINAGLLIGFINELKNHGLVTAFLEKAGWVFLQLGVFLLPFSYMKMITLAPIGCYIIIALGVLIIYFGEGFRGIIELPSIFGQILSYLRLMAIGLSSVGIAIVVNDMAAPLFAAGILGIIFGTLVLLLGHTLNIIVGCFGSFIHSLRLHYVEQFSKFYAGGGTEYAPFGKYTRE